MSLIPAFPAAAEMPSSSPHVLAEPLNALEPTVTFSLGILTQLPCPSERKAGENALIVYNTSIYILPVYVNTVNIILRLKTIESYKKPDLFAHFLSDSLCHKRAWLGTYAGF